jgi:phosphoenolpyruvate---glycerone phosphotransferase subunit DhaM
MVGIVVVSHSSQLARGLVDLASQMAGSRVRIEHAGGTADGQLGTDERRIREAIRRADTGSGVAVLGDLGSAILMIRHVLESRANGHVRLIDAPIVEGAVAAAVSASGGSPLDDVVRAAEQARTSQLCRSRL